MLEQLLQSSIYMEPTNQKATSIEEEEEIVLESLDDEEAPREEK